MQNKVIVFGCNHQNALGLVRSLGEKGIRPYCVLLQNKDGLVFRSKYPALCQWVENPDAGLQYIIENFQNEAIKPILLSSDDVTETIFDKYASALRKDFIVPASSEDGKLTRLMEKQNIGFFANKYGFITPETFVLKKSETIPNNLTYPVFTKSVKSIDGGKQEERKCNNRIELEDVLLKCRSNELLVQQFIDKKDELDFIGYVANGQVYIPYIQHQLRFSDHAYGGYHRFDKIEGGELIEKIKSMICDICFQGLFSVEFLVDKNDNWFFTEINFRHDGHDYLITSAGINLPWLYCCAVSGEDVELQPKVIKESFTGMNELVDLNQFVSTRIISPVKWFWQFLTADTHILWNWKDNEPLRYMVKSRFQKTLQ